MEIRVKPNTKCHVVCCIVKKEAGHLYCIRCFALVLFWWSKGRKSICIIQLASRRGHYESLMCVLLLGPPLSPCVCLPLYFVSLSVSSLIAFTCFASLNFWKNVPWFLYFKAIISMNLCQEPVSNYIQNTCSKAQNTCKAQVEIGNCS